MTTRRLFIEETTPGATGLGTREVWEPSDSDLAELGYQRIPKPTLFEPAGYVADGTPVYTVTHPAPPEPTNGHPVLHPCPLHTNLPSTLCGACRAWDEREGAALGE